MRQVKAVYVHICKVFTYFAHFQLSHLSFYYSSVSILYTFWMQVFHQMCILQIFYLSLSIWNILKISFYDQSLILIKSHILLILLLIIFISKEFLPRRLRKYCSTFSSINFIVLAFTFGPISLKLRFSMMEFFQDNYPVVLALLVENVH